MIQKQIRVAFIASRGQWSSDRVVADPELNRQYCRACREQGLSLSDEEMNRRLLNARKAGVLSGLRAACKTSFATESDYAFASEIAIRFLERRDGVTLDQVICSPERVAEFDAVAARVCPGYSVLQYRWAALNLRKKRRMRPELIAQICRPTVSINTPVRSLDLDAVPVVQGLYMFFHSGGALYAGETTNLRKRLSKHLEHSDNRGLAHWLWQHGPDDLSVEVHTLPDNTSVRVRRALEAELIESRLPAFNVKGR